MSHTYQARPCGFCKILSDPPHTVCVSPRAQWRAHAAVSHPYTARGATELQSKVTRWLIYWYPFQWKLHCAITLALSTSTSVLIVDSKSRHVLSSCFKREHVPDPANRWWDNTDRYSHTPVNHYTWLLIQILFSTSSGSSQVYPYVVCEGGKVVYAAKCHKQFAAGICVCVCVCSIIGTIQQPTGFSVGNPPENIE